MLEKVEFNQLRIIKNLMIKVKLNGNSLNLN